MKKVLFIAILLIYPVFNLQAVTYISEIMYDPVGTDSKREWIEVYSDDYSDISNIKLRENETSHILKLYQEGDSVNYFVIADNPEEFLKDNTGFSGYLYDSAFSLSNSGELISILINDQVLDEVFYSPNIGANGDGNSLQKNGEVFIPSTSTPGKENSKDAVYEDTNVDNNDSSQSSAHSSYVEISESKPDVVEIGVGRERVVSINTPIDFEVYLKNKTKGRFLWSLGDGRSERGRKIKVIYKKEGLYNIVLNSALGSSYAVSRTKVLVFKPKVEVEFYEGEVNIKNNSDHELNIGYFNLASGENEFIFPLDTIISKNGEIVLGEDILGFEPHNDVQIYYPGGKIPLVVTE